MSTPRSVGAVIRSVLTLFVVVSACVVPGCSFGGVSIDVDGVDARWITVPGTGDRQAVVVTPSKDNGTRRRSRPLFVVLHGAGQNPEEMTTYGGWAAAARDHDAVAVFPEGVEHTFNAGTCCGTASAQQVDDVGYLDRLIRTVTSKVGADPSKVYMVGFSNGGMMTYRYLCEGATRLRGAASLAGTNVAGCTPTRPTPFLQVSGTNDDIVPIGNTRPAAPELGPLVPVNQAVQQVAEAFACPGRRRDVVGSVTTNTWSPCAEGVTVRYDVLADLPHTYPIQGAYNATDQALTMWGFS